MRAFISNAGRWARRIRAKSENVLGRPTLAPRGVIVLLVLNFGRSWILGDTLVMGRLREGVPWLR